PEPAAAALSPARPRCRPPRPTLYAPAAPQRRPAGAHVGVASPTFCPPSIRPRKSVGPCYAVLGRPPRLGSATGPQLRRNQTMGSASAEVARGEVHLSGRR